MPTFTRYVQAVDSREIYRAPAWSQARIPKGTRYDIHLRTDHSAIWGETVYTRDALTASLCLQAKKTDRQITVGTRDTKYGSEIVTVELVGSDVAEVL